MSGKPDTANVARILAGILVPLATPAGAFLLHQSGVVSIPWPAGAIAVMIVSGILCGFFLRSTLAAGYIFALWAIWAVVSIATDSGRYDPPAEAAVLYMLPLAALPAMVAALVGVAATKLFRFGSP